MLFLKLSTRKIAMHAVIGTVLSKNSLLLNLTKCQPALVTKSFTGTQKSAFHQRFLRTTVRCFLIFFCTLLMTTFWMRIRRGKHRTTHFPLYPLNVRWGTKADLTSFQSCVDPCLASSQTEAGLETGFAKTHFSKMGNMEKRKNDSFQCSTYLGPNCTKEDFQVVLKQLDKASVCNGAKISDTGPFCPLRRLIGPLFNVLQSK